MNEIAVSDQSVLVGEKVDELQGRRNEFGMNARAQSTIAGYNSDIRLFTAWCRKHDLLAFPAAYGTLSLYVTELATREPKPLKASTINRRVNSIALEHRRRGLGDLRSDMFQDVHKGVRRTIGTKRTGKAALTREQMQTVFESLPYDLRGRRDAAMIALGYHAALRRSEIAAIEVGHIVEVPRGLLVHIPRSKTDQTAEGAVVLVESKPGNPVCPVMIVRSYLNMCGISAGPIFKHIDAEDKVRPRAAITGHSICRIVQGRIAKALGLDEKAKMAYGAHSLRASFATNLSERGRSLATIMERGRWRDHNVAQSYIRPDSYQDRIADDL